MKIIGVMSGSSLDGLDVAAYDISESDSQTSQPSIIRLYGKTIKYNHLKTMLERVTDGSSLKEVLILENDYSKWISQQIKHCIEEWKIVPDYTSIHGHTVTHEPERNISFQIGHGGIISAITGIPALTDFRRGDMALGGKGTPLTPLLDALDYSQYGLVVNLGGICNVSYDYQGTRYGYDLFPCNQVFNHFARKFGKEYDEGGQIAQQGKIDDQLYESLVSHRLLTVHKPQAIDNSWIKYKFIPEMEYYNSSDKDKMYTFTCALANVISAHAEKIGANSVYITGGGIHNDFLRAQLTYQLNGMELIVPKKEDADYKECKLMALLAYYRVTKQENILASVTGASKNSIGGSIHI